MKELSEKQIEDIRKFSLDGEKPWRGTCFGVGSWADISAYYKLSEDFMEEFQDQLIWSYICIYQTLSEDFIKKFEDKVYWLYVSYHQRLSENFIREFQDKVFWDSISYRQKLSKEFIEEFEDKLFFNYLFQNTCIDVEIKDFISEKKESNNNLSKLLMRKGIKSERII